MHRTGLYYWAGPGTIRLLQTKYFSPHIDHENFLHAYDTKTLKKLRQTLHITDAWLTYSWGFSDITEQEDYAFLRTHIKAFHDQRIHVHAYIQGLNLVTNEWKDHDLWCKDPFGHRIPYSKGRSFTCLNNPQARAILVQRVKQACKEPVEGIYIDNLLFGLPPIAVFSDFLPFCGCSCRYCQKKFKQYYGYDLPLSYKRNQQVADYLKFRTRCLTELVKELQALAKSAHKLFGINLYDPIQYTPELYFGYCLQDIAPYLDYLLIENHSLPSEPGRDNHHLQPLLQHTKKPVFVVSYNKGIGWETQYTQRQINAIYTESKQLGYSPCIKGTEFTTDGIWHSLRLDQLRKPNTTRLSPGTHQHPSCLLKSSTLFGRSLTRIVQPLLLWIYGHSTTNPFLYRLKNVFYVRQLTAWKNYQSVFILSVVSSASLFFLVYT